MELEKRRPRLTFALLVAAIVIMMIQNYLLVKKNSQLVARVEWLNEQVVRQTVMQRGDTVFMFTALNEDSAFVRIDPTESSKKLYFVFTTWCDACLQNMPAWASLLREIRDENLTIVGISPDQPSKIREYRSRLSLSFPVYSIANDSAVMKRYKLLSVPQTILVDSAGLVVRVWFGVLADKAKEEIKKSI